MIPDPPESRELSRRTVNKTSLNIQSPSGDGPPPRSPLTQAGSLLEGNYSRFL